MSDDINIIESLVLQARLMGLVSDNEILEYVYFMLYEVYEYDSLDI